MSAHMSLTAQVAPDLLITPIDNPAEVPGLVRNILNGGGFDTIYSINYTGNMNGIGIFEHGQFLGFSKGIILSSGNVMNAMGINPNGASYKEDDQLLDTLFGQGNDPDLARLLGQMNGSDKPIPVADASVLTFYARPYSDKITMWFVFASEEYPHYQTELGKPDFIGVDSAKQDVMGIWLWSNPNDKKLISRFQPGGPGVWYPISMKYVNRNTYGGVYYVENPPNPPFTPVYSTEFDGFSVPFIATNQDFEVVPCVTYGIKIAVADYYYNGEQAGNPFANFFNTAIFLEEGSLVGGSGLEWSLSFQNDNNDFGPKEIVEGGCAKMVITLRKTVETLDTLKVRFKVVNADPGEYTITPAPVNDTMLWITRLDTIMHYTLEAHFDGIPEGTGGIERWYFKYQEDLCDVPGTGWGGSHQGYSGVDTIFVYDYMAFNNANKSYGPNPSNIYFCGNTVPVTITDVLQGGIPPYSYTWTNPPQISTGAVFNTVINGSPDYAYCTVTDRCTGLPGYLSGHDTVTIYSTLEVQASPDFQLCQNGQSQIKVQWANVGRAFSTVWYFQGNPVGYDSIYTVTWAEYGGYAPNSLEFTCEVTDDCGNTASDQVNATFFPVVEITGVPLICLGETIQLTCTPAQQYQWYRNSITPGNAIPGAVNPALNYTPATPGFHTICVQILNECDEWADTCYTFEVSELVCAVRLNGSTNFQVCPNVPFSLQEINAYGGWSWSWTDGGTNHTASGQTITLSLTDAGPHQVRVIAYNIHGCYDTLTATVTVHPYAQLQAFTEHASVCQGYPTRLSASPNGPVTIGNYFWTSTPLDNSLGPQQTSPTPIVTPQVTTTYQCRIMDNNGCFDSTTVQVLVRPPIAGSIITSPLSACTGKQVQLNFQPVVAPLPGASYYWSFEGGSPPSSTLQQPTVLWVTDGLKKVQLTISEPGCEETFEVWYTVHPDPLALFSATNNTGCQPVEASFSDQSQNLQNPTYLWEFGDGQTSTLPNPTHLYENPGNYDVTLTVTNATGCVNTLTIYNQVEVYAVPVADFTADPQAATIDNPTIRFTDQTNIPWSIIEWDFGDGATASGDPTPRHTYGAPGSYFVVMYTETEHGCWDRDTLEIGILEDIKIFVPNAFSPNGDGMNDCFSVGGTTGDIIEVFRVIIYSRWGQQVYESAVTDPNCVWDGKDMSGNIVTPDTYIFRIFGKSYKGAKKVYEGMVTVVK